MTVTILITRPEPEARRMAVEVQALCDAVAVVISPVMRIAYDGVLPEMSGEEVLIFTSRHGVEGFCRLSARRDFTCYAVGDATAEAAEAQGMRAISAGGDAEALLARIAAEGGHGPFVHLRGAHVAADIAGALRAAGHMARDAVVYDQVESALSAEAQALLGGAEPVILPLMSPRTARIVLGQAGPITAPLYIAAISRKVADNVPEGVAQRVDIAETPDLPGMLALVQHQVQMAKRLEGGKRPQ
ncbi:Uroporphyrinogen-III synthase [Roseovarius mucosus DSM 17069]|uniref:Uroporphyrinogen-III synthase n=1 Tax=Roseovarius mucosus DSM 17069 TaxID=1288298 RepID=A0A0A0HRG6_9RHOB|nr:uroporphyrinogen-III synthase [Roseovarius mucosus]KGM89551.1 Uroporphyrinogen-III synthase [Roseovarius mucosus DSM 17069]